jgi:uncharacterized protein (TIGR02147 family)
MADIFDFADHRAFLRASQRKHPATNRAMTLEVWVKRLGYQSPRSVAMVLKGQRLPSRDLIEALSKDLKLDTPRMRYFELLVQRERHAQEGEKLDHIHRDIQELNPKNLKRKVLDESRLTPISDWHNLVVRQLVDLPGFQEDEAWISKRLRGKVSPEAIKQGIALMLRNGYLVRTREGKLELPGEEALITKQDVPSTDIRRHHAGMMQRAVEALVEQDVSAREFGTCTIRVDAKRLAEAKKAIREFQASFNARFSADESARVFQLNLQFFEHTNGNDEA